MCIETAPPSISRDRMSGPVILFQGLEDRVVPPTRPKFRGRVPGEEAAIAYVPFEGEQHGFRRDKNIRRASEAELYFLSRIYGFELADEVEPVEMEFTRSTGRGVGERI